MSGIEAVGIVLGAIPLIIVAVQHYAEGVSTIRRYLKYKHGLKDIARSLQTEYDIFRNTCEQLLGGLVHDHELSKLLSEPSGADWEAPALKRKIETRLRGSFDGYIQTMKEMESAVNKFRDLLRLDTNRKSQCVETNGFEQAYRKLKFTLKKSDYDALMVSIRQHNVTLCTLARQALDLEPRRARRSRGHPNIKGIHTYASNLYDTLSTGFNCACRDFHRLSLRLDCHNNCQSSFYDNGPEDELQFRVIFTTPLQQSCLPADVHTIKSPKGVGYNLRSRRNRFSIPDPSASITSPTGPPVTRSSNLAASQPIQNLCAIIAKLQEPYQGSCIGTLEDRFSLTQPTTFVPAPALTTQLSLDMILSSPQAIMGRNLYRLDVLRLAIVLTTSFLQLHKTPWICDAWKINDIYFLEGPADGFLEKPFVIRSCISADQSSSQPATDPDELATSTGIRNRPLFELGIMLIELCLKAPFEVLRMRYKPAGSSNSGAGDSDFAIANRLVDEVYMESLRYGDAVWRCIWCDFGPRQKTSLEDEGFLRAVYDGVVSVLEEDFRDGFSE